MAKVEYAISPPAPARIALRRLLSVMLGLLLGFNCNGVAHATYLAAYIAPSFVVVGVDSRETHFDGTKPNDNVCKIAFLGSDYIVSLEGAPDFGVDGTSVFQIAKEFYKDHRNLDSEAFASELSNRLVSVLNSKHVVFNRGITTLVALARVAKTGAKWMIIPIFSSGQAFEARSLEVHKTPNKFISFDSRDEMKSVNQKIATNPFLRSDLFQMEPSTREQYLMELRIKGLIAITSRQNVGGVATVAVINDAGPSWWTKATSCPDR